MIQQKIRNPIPMNAMEKVAWTELLVSSLTILTVIILLPFLGHKSTSAFALLGVVVCSLWFIRGRKKKIIIDERDRDIEKRSTRRGVETAWMFLVISLIIITFWPRSTTPDNESFLRTSLNWLIWLQFAIYIGIKGLAGIIYYRRKNHGA